MVRHSPSMAAGDGHTNRFYKYSYSGFLRKAQARLFRKKNSFLSGEYSR